MHMFIEEVAHASMYITMCAARSKRKWLQHDCNESNYTKVCIIYLYITHWRTNGAYVGAAAATAGAGTGVALVVVTVVVVPAVAEVTVVVTVGMV